jgi:aldehyde dehydrogenase (NAD+)
MAKAISLDDVAAEVQKLKNSFATHKTKSYDWRVAQLLGLHKMITENRQTLIEAVQRDLGKKVRLFLPCLAPL